MVAILSRPQCVLIVNGRISGQLRQGAAGIYVVSEGACLGQYSCAPFRWIVRGICFPQHVMIITSLMFNATPHLEMDTWLEALLINK